MVVGLLVAVLLVGAEAFTVSAAAAAQDQNDSLSVNWYHEGRVLQPVIDEFSLDTGIEVVVTDDYDTFTTDVLLISDYKGLTEAKKFRHFQKLNSPYADRVVPPQWRDRDGYWVGIVLRARAPIYNKSIVSDGDVPKSWFDLTDDRWRGKIKLRGAENVYNRSLLAWIVHHFGEERAMEWARGVRENAGMAPVFEGDTANAEDVSSGLFPLSFVNTYYLGYMDGPWAEYFGEAPTKNIAIAWLDQGDPGQHVNVTGAAINKATEKEDEARRLIEWLLSKEGQSLLSEHVLKYPVRRDVAPSEYLQAQGEFEMDDTDLNDLELYYDVADRIYREAGWPRNW